MDGISVKINEKYKPPPKISLPSCILNRLNNVQFTNYGYDFSLETTVVQHVVKLNQISRDAIEKKSEGGTIGDERLSPEPEKSEERQSEAAILTPVPISTPNPVTKVRQENRFKYSDFENDTSSPFDNEELKTLNDMEELAHVLGVSTISRANENGGVCIPGTVNGQWSTINYGSPTLNQYYCTNNSYSASYPATQVSATPLNTYANAVNYHAYSSNNPSQFYENKVNSGCLVNNGQSINDDQEGTREIVKSFQEFIVQRQQPNPTNDYPVDKINLQKSLHKQSMVNLSEDERKLANHFEEMGFPLTRVLAAVKTIGLDDTKIIEYLLLVQKFVDKGFTESQTIHALDANECDEIHTDKYLKILSDIMKLGFKEEEVVTALARTQNDQDKALEILIP